MNIKSVRMMYPDGSVKYAEVGNTFKQRMLLKDDEGSRTVHKIELTPTGGVILYFVGCTQLMLIQDVCFELTAEFTEEGAE